jgi:DNA-binding NtrC family response regulator
MVAATGSSRKQREVPHLSILVVDDDPDVCEYLQDFLSSEGYSVTVLNDPTRTLDRMKEEEFHVVVLDLMMPKLSGIDLLGQIRAADDDIAIIILTGYPSLETATSSIEHDVSAYIRKPFSLEEFRDAIGRIAKKKGLRARRVVGVGVEPVQGRHRPRREDHRAVRDLLSRGPSPRGAGAAGRAEAQPRAAFAFCFIAAIVAA